MASVVWRGVVSGEMILPSLVGFALSLEHGDVWERSQGTVCLPFVAWVWLQASSEVWWWSALIWFLFSFPHPEVMIILE